MTILVASSNPHKVEEIRAVFEAQRARGVAGAGAAVALVSLEDIQLDVPEPHEDQPTFEGNAVLKARHYAKASGRWCLADDSGLEVDALNGAPGVHSARYAGVSGGSPRGVVDAANNRKLLEQLQGVPAEKRTARFVCVMALAAPQKGGGRVLPTVRGTVEGRILLPEEAADPSQPHRGRGGHGFGYDPLFLLPRRGKTTAELSPAEKNAISHRGQAARLMWGAIQRMLGGG